METVRVSTFGRSGAHEVAARDGLYAAEGLEVELDQTQSSKAQMSKLLDGTWHVVHTNADNVFWWDEDNGADFVIVLALPSAAGQTLIVRPEIAGYADLRGKVLAVDAALSGYVTPLRVLLKEGGLPNEGSDYTFIEVGNTQARVDALKDGRAFGAMIGDAQAKEMVAQGFPVLDNISRLYTNHAGSAAVRRAWAEQHEDTLLRYLRAHLRALQTMGTTPTFAWDGLQEMVQMRKDVGLLRGAVDPKRFASDTWYRQAVAAL